MEFLLVGQVVERQEFPVPLAPGEDELSALAAAGALLLLIIIGIKLLPLFGTGGKVFAIGVVCVCFVVLLAFAIYAIIRHNSYPNWLDRVGISRMEDVPGSQKAHDLAIEKGQAEMLSTDERYVLSTAFCKKLLQSIDRQRIMTGEAFKTSCRNAAPKFQLEYTDVLLDYLSVNEQLLELRPEGPYLSWGMVADCEYLLNREGAATEEEFAAMCVKSPAASCLYEDRIQLARVILTNMVRSGKASTAKHNGGGNLYVSANPTKDCRMTKREVSLDD